MTTIGLKIDRAVIAYDPHGSGPGQHGGNVGVESGDTVGWQCANNGHSFLVRFYRFGTTEGIWPFEGDADLIEADPDPEKPVIEYLRVESTTVKTKRLNTEETLKYEVKVERGPDAVPLDPTIIIRSKNLAQHSVIFGVTCAVLGAVAGALLTALWT